VQTTSFVAAVKVLALEARSRLLEHPTPGELVAYWSGDLPPGETDGLQEHLTLCHDCSQALLDLATFVDFPDLPSPIDLEVEEAWRRFRSHTGFERTTVGPIPFRPTRLPSVLPSSWSRLAFSLAAVLLVAVLGLSVWNMALVRRINEILQPVPNVAVVDLFSDSVRGGPFMPQTLTGDTVLLLHPMGEVFAEYEAEIFKDEEVLRRVGGLRADEDGNLTLMLSRHLLTPGRYRAQLSGVADRRRAHVGWYRFNVRGYETER
jgi:hypothetical protein